MKGAEKKTTEENEGEMKEVDWNEMHQTVIHICNSNWFKTGKDDPSFIAYVMDELSGRVVRQSEYLSKK